MKKQIVVASALALFVCSNFSIPAQANPIAAPACRDVPSCGVAGIIIGTEIIGGVLYYVVQNAAGAVHKVRAKTQVPPAHRTVEPGRQRIGDTVTVIVERREQCEQRARRYGRETDGGEWVVDNIEVIGTPGAPARVNPDGSIHEEPIKFKCRLRKVK